MVEKVVSFLYFDIDEATFSVTKAALVRKQATTLHCCKARSLKMVEGGTNCEFRMALCLSPDDEGSPEVFVGSLCWTRSADPHCCENWYLKVHKGKYQYDTQPKNAQTTLLNCWV